MRKSFRLVVLRILMSTIVAGALASGPVSAQAAPAHAPIQGSGSSWAYNAVNQWIADTSTQGLQVVFTSTGSTQGRQDFAQRTNDFAVSDIGFQGTDLLTGQPDTPQGRQFGYLPLVAGGTSFPYQIRVGGQLFRGLRLSGLTLAKIFANRITSWDDPAVTADNNGHQLPPIPVIPVVHSEGSGATAQFTAYLDHQYPDIWRPFFGMAGSTEYFPREGAAVSQNGSDGVMNFVSAGGSNGAIGFDEYSFALGQDYPVAKVENAAGYFSLPTQYNVAIALTKAVINQDPTSPDYLLADLGHVYTNDDPRTYPLSSYAYGIIPTSPVDPRMNTAKRQTLADFLAYSLCRGQYETGPIGYSPLPYNLVQGAFQQIDRLKQADPNVDLTGDAISTCDNPTFVPGDPSSNRLLQTAPQPPPCDQAGHGPCEFLAVDTTPLPPGTVGTPYSATLQAHGGTPPYSWQLLGTSLPPGLTLDPATGTISGTPTAATDTFFTVQATDSTSPVPNRASGLVPLIVKPAPPLVIGTAYLPTATVGSPYTATLSAAGGSASYTWSVTPGSLPAGLGLAASGVISGTPTTAGTVSFMVTVTDSGVPQPAVTSATFSIITEPAAAPSPPLRILRAHLGAGTLGSEYAETLKARGGTKPYTWSVAAGSLPPGLTLDPAAGSIEGTPTAAGTFPFTISVTDAGSPTRQVATRDVTIHIKRPHRPHPWWTAWQ